MNTMNNDNLQNTLNKMIQSGSRSNPALNMLVNDYITYHVVLVVVGGLVVLMFLLLSLFFWTQWKAVAITLSLVLLVIVVVNLQGAFAPITLMLLDG